MTHITGFRGSGPSSHPWRTACCQYADQWLWESHLQILWGEGV